MNTLPFEVPSPDGTAREDWEYVRFADYVRCQWVPQGDGSYELQFLVCGYG